MEEDVADRCSTAPSPERGFRVIYQKSFAYPSRLGLIHWSPQLDLIALVTANDTVLLYRMSGQRVWGVAHKLGPDIRIEQLRWRPDGKMIAVGYSDGSTRIYDVNNGKPIHKLVSEASDFGAVTCVSWVDNHSHSINTNISPETKSTECTPQALFDLDISSMLPRLSVLPSSSGPESSFTSKTTLDALINAVTKGGEGSHLDVILIGEKGGKVLLNVFDSFLIGTMDLSKLSLQLKEPTKVIRHTASSDLSTQSLILVRNKSGNLIFTTMDILFIHQFGQHLFQLASTSTRVQALLRYMSETIRALQTEFKAMNDLSRRYVRSISNEAEDAGSEVGLEFFEFLVTGLPSPILREWLLEVLMERGQKTWEKGCITGYETIRRLAHEHLLPTCERLVVLFCRLRGLARWKESGSPLGLEPDDFTRCLDVVSGITLFTHELLIKVNKELDLCTSFMGWLKHALDQLSTVIDIDDKPVDEPTVDALKVAEFIGSHLKHSTLEPFFQRDHGPRLHDVKQRGESISELYSKTDGSTLLPGFGELVEFLEELCKSVFSKPQQAMRQQLRLGKPLLLHQQELRIMEMRMADNDKGGSSAFMVLNSDDLAPNSLIVVKCDIKVTGGLSSTESVGCAKLSFLENHQELIDLKFVDDSILILVLRNPDKSSVLLTIDYSSIQFENDYLSLKQPQSLFSYSINLNAQSMNVVMQRDYQSSWVPVQVIVNGKEGRRIGCVVAEDKMRYSIFDLDNPEEDEDEEYASDAEMELDKKYEE